MYGGVEDAGLGGHYVMKQGNWWESFYSNPSESMVIQIMVGKIKGCEKKDHEFFYHEYILRKDSTESAKQLN